MISNYLESFKILRRKENKLEKIEYIICEIEIIHNEAEVKFWPPNYKGSFNLNYDHCKILKRILDERPKEYYIDLNSYNFWLINDEEFSWNNLEITINYSREVIKFINYQNSDKIIIIELLFSEWNEILLVLKI